jgi:hypothetical protein
MPTFFQCASCACLLPLLGGCLVQEPPELEDPQQTRPFIRIHGVTPSPAVVWLVSLRLEESAPEHITVPIQSEDREPVKGALHFDYQFASQDFIAAAVLEPSTLSAGPRDATFDWRVGRRADQLGCHRLTAVFAHLSNFDESTQLPAPEAEADSESISWLVNVYKESDGVDETVLTDCPR